MGGLTLPKSIEQYISDNGTCDGQFTSIFLRKQVDGARKLIGYSAQSYEKEETNIYSTNCGCPAVAQTAYLLRPCLQGGQFVLWMDDHGSPGILNFADARNVQAHWLIELLRYDFEIVYWAVVQLKVITILSRISTTAVDSTALEVLVPVKVVPGMKMHS